MAAANPELDQGGDSMSGGTHRRPGAHGRSQFDHLVKGGESGLDVWPRWLPVPDPESAVDGCTVL